MLPCSTFLDVRSCYACFSSLRMGLRELRPVLPDGFRAGEYSAFRCLPAISNGVEFGRYSMEAKSGGVYAKIHAPSVRHNRSGSGRFKDYFGIDPYPIPQRAAPDELLSLSLSEVSKRIRSKQVTSVEPTQALLDSIKVYNPKLNAY